ncbi:MAG: membrane protein insertion efficiency factor YidD [Candidatus Omnitrophota bacterium]
MLRSYLSAAITTYQKYIRPALPVSCRFVPSCSEYTRQAVIKYGPVKGLWLGCKRIFKCNPCSGKSGYDPLV